MSHGIEIVNAFGKTIIDEKYANYYIDSTSPYTVAPGATYPPAGTDSTDLIFARPPQGENKTVAIQYLATAGQPPIWAVDDYDLAIFPNYAGEPTSYKYFRAKKYTDLAIPSGFGLQVYGSSGELFFTTPENLSFEVVAVGNIRGASHVTFPSTSGVFSDLDKYYCLMNTCAYAAVNARFYGYEVACFYTYEWVTSTSGRIKIDSELYFNDGFADTYNPENFDYMIVKIVG